MPTGIRIPVKHDEVLVTTNDDQISFVLSRIFLGGTEEAAAIGVFSTGRVDVFVPPGTPECFHDDAYDSARMSGRFVD